jgi:Dimerisation domain
MGGETSDERAALRRMIDGYRVSRAIGVAAELGIADLIADGPRGVDELARVTGAHPRSLFRLLRALAAVGVFAEEEGEAGRFRLTAIGEALRGDVAGSYLATAMQTGQESM